MKYIDSKRLLVVALNYAPELTGIGKYVGEMTAWLATQNVAIRVVTAPPYYPAWVVQPGYSARWYSREHVAGADAVRCPLWVPRQPRGLTRVLHLVSFALSSFPVVVWQAIFWRPHLVFVVEPPLAAAPGVWLAAKLCGARTWLHVQDLETDAAFDLGLLRPGKVQRAILAVERVLMRRFDRVSSISDRMHARLLQKGVDPKRVVSFPNWVDLSLIRPLEGENPLRRQLGIGENARVLLYSGNMGEKQGLEILIEVARRSASTTNALFLLCGDGVARPRLERAAAGLSNVRFLPLQPLSRLNELLNLADVHLLPQRAAAQDLVMPSKLAAMMASGRPVLATAHSGSDVARVVSEGGLVVAPGDVEALCLAIERLLADDALRQRMGQSGRAYAEAQWERDAVLRRAFSAFQACADGA